MYALKSISIFNKSLGSHYFRADIALIGLAVMGQNLILNMADNGFTVCLQ